MAIRDLVVSALGILALALLCVALAQRKRVNTPDIERLEQSVRAEEERQRRAYRERRHG